jgi:alkanesulfonate monooxygenase SsuD/methylene tetrahydromethanopterin reductase-like flavin-dependent oxidoreductase (luciferase family)
MPSPNLLAAALTQKTKQGKIIVLGDLLPLYLNPLRVAEEYAMLDNMSDGRLIAGFAPGSGPETFNYDVASAPSREQFWEAVELIEQAWTKPGPFPFEGKHYPLRYVNPWPQPTQSPHPPIWIPGARSHETLVQIAKRGYCYFLSSRSHGKETAKSVQKFAGVLKDHDKHYHPNRMGILMSTYVGETDKIAQEESREGIWYFLRYCLKGHQRREGRQLTFGPGVPYIPVDEFKEYLKHSDPTTPLLGDTEDWGDLQRSQSIIVGSPDTVYRRFMDVLEHAHVGHLLIQFHMGNMSDEMARKSMRLFWTEVAPRLKQATGPLYEQMFGKAEEKAVQEVLS